MFLYKQKNIELEIIPDPVGTDPQSKSNDVNEAVNEFDNFNKEMDGAFHYIRLISICLFLRDENLSQDELSEKSEFDENDYYSKSKLITYDLSNIPQWMQSRDETMSWYLSRF